MSTNTSTDTNASTNASTSASTDATSAANETSQRRRFLYWLTGGITLATAWSLLSAVWEFLTAPALRRSALAPMPLGRLAEFFAERDYRLVKFGYRNVIVLKSPTHATTPNARSLGIRAFDLRCTHAGCTVQWQPDKRFFVCNCHGGEFAEDGSVRRLPPTEPLVELLVEISSTTNAPHDQNDHHHLTLRDVVVDGSSRTPSSSSW
jgi:Rieske Fe-S protein